MTIKKILIVCRPTSYRYFKRPGRKIFLQKISRAYKAHGAAVLRIKKIVGRTGIPFRMTTGKLKGPMDSDLIITVGGDGTFLRTSHLVGSQMILGVNSYPALSVGALCSTTVDFFESKLKKILSGKFRIRKLNRLEIRINDMKFKIQALNDILYANRSPAGTSRYLIRIGAKSEEQKSSGVWVATAAGSTAAIYAAGGKKLPIQSKMIQYRVREPYGRHRYKLACGIIPYGSSLYLCSLLKNAALYLDGMQGIVHLKEGDRVRIKNSSTPLKVII